MTLDEWAFTGLALMYLFAVVGIITAFRGGR